MFDLVFGFVLPVGLFVVSLGCFLLGLFAGLLALLLEFWVALV